MFTFLAFLFVAFVVILPTATSYNVLQNSPTVKPAFSRRQMLSSTTALVGGTAFWAQLSQPAAAATASATKPDLDLIKTTSDRYRSALADKDKFVGNLASEDTSLASPLPTQIPAVTFQKLAKGAHDVTGKMEADDFPFVAIEYAEHAGAARDFAKLARLGRIGENGSAEVALDYAERCVVELEEASVILDTLRQAVE